jgi:hypothetical protein
MKRLIFVLLMMTCSVSWADWKLVSADEESITYADRASIHKKGNFVEMWAMQVFFKAQSDSGKTYRSSKDLHRYDCNNKTVGFVMFVWYDKLNGTGNVVISESIRQNEIEDHPVVPETIGALLLKIACEYN